MFIYGHIQPITPFLPPPHPTQGHFSGITYHLGCRHLSCEDAVVTMALGCDWESEDPAPAKVFIVLNFPRHSLPLFLTEGRMMRLFQTRFLTLCNMYFVSPALTALFHSTAAVPKLSGTMPSPRNHSGKTGWQRQISASERM